MTRCAVLGALCCSPDLIDFYDGSSWDVKNRPSILYIIEPGPPLRPGVYTPIPPSDTVSFTSTVSESNSLTSSVSDTASTSETPSVTPSFGSSPTPSPSATATPSDTATSTTTPTASDTSSESPSSTPSSWTGGVRVRGQTSGEQSQGTASPMIVGVVVGTVAVVVMGSVLVIIARRRSMKGSTDAQGGKPSTACDGDAECEPLRGADAATTLTDASLARADVNLNSGVVAPASSGSDAVSTMWDADEGVVTVSITGTGSQAPRASDSGLLARRVSDSSVPPVVAAAGESTGSAQVLAIHRDGDVRASLSEGVTTSALPERAVDAAPRSVPPSDDLKDGATARRRHPSRSARGPRKTRRRVRRASAASGESEELTQLRWRESSSMARSKESSASASVSESESGATGGNDSDEGSGTGTGSAASLSGGSGTSCGGVSSGSDSSGERRRRGLDPDFLQWLARLRRYLSDIDSMLHSDDESDASDADDAGAGSALGVSVANNSEDARAVASADSDLAALLMMSGVVGSHGDIAGAAGASVDLRRLRRLLRRCRRALRKADSALLRSQPDDSKVIETPASHDARGWGPLTATEADRAKVDELRRVLRVSFTS